MRPTIPISEWRIAVHLEETKSVQNQEGTPAFGCTCEWCQKWKNNFSKALPEKTIQELKRLGIDPAYPTDLYKYQENEKGNYLRVVYHVVGKILSGPSQWKETDLGKSLIYHTIRESPSTSIVVFPQRESFDEAPSFNNTAEGDLIRVDFRLCMELGT